MIPPMTENIGNLKARYAIKRKIIENERNRTRQTRHQVTMISPTKVIIKARDAIRIKAIVKGTLSNYAQN